MRGQHVLLRRYQKWWGGTNIYFRRGKWLHITAE